MRQNLMCAGGGGGGKWLEAKYAFGFEARFLLVFDLSLPLFVSLSALTDRITFKGKSPLEGRQADAFFPSKTVDRKRKSLV
jgi:hypothetical protein